MICPLKIWYFSGENQCIVDSLDVGGLISIKECDRMSASSTVAFPIFRNSIRKIVIQCLSKKYIQILALIKIYIWNIVLINIFKNIKMTSNKLIFLLNLKIAVYTHVYIYKYLFGVFFKFSSCVILKSLYTLCLTYPTLTLNLTTTNAEQKVWVSRTFAVDKSNLTHLSKL